MGWHDALLSSLPRPDLRLLVECRASARQQSVLPYEIPNSESVSGRLLRYPLGSHLANDTVHEAPAEGEAPIAELQNVIPRATASRHDLDHPMRPLVGRLRQRHLDHPLDHRRRHGAPELSLGARISPGSCRAHGESKPPIKG